MIFFEGANLFLESHFIIIGHKSEIFAYAVVELCKIAQLIKKNVSCKFSTSRTENEI